MNRTMSAILLGLLMVMMPLAGCVSDGTDGLQGPEGPEGPPGADGTDGSSLHLVVAESDLPECNGDLQGQIYFVSSDGAFQVCSTMGWSVVDLTGPAGTNGTNGTDGLNGQDGLFALAVTTTLSSTNSNCIDGGVQIDVGMDDNGNAILDAGEIDETTYICNGEKGTNGQDGQDGLDGTDGNASPDTMLTSVSNPTLEACSFDSRVIEQGLDNGDGGGTAKNGVLESGEVDYTTTYCSNYAVKLVVQDPIPVSSAGFVSIGNRLYFQGNMMGDRFLWIYDIDLEQFWSPAGSPTAPNWLTVMGTRIYFEASDNGNGNELWAYETTNETYWQVADIYGSGSGHANHITAVGTRLYFEASSANSGYELWVHETTNDSTWIVAHINLNGASYPDYMTPIGTRLYFSATNGIDGRELWVHETTNDSTWQVAEIRNGGGSSSPFDLTVVGTRLYFGANDGNTDDELWAHETTNESTWQVTTIFGDVLVPINGITSMGTRLYFQADDGITGQELWAHETTNDTTWQVADINAGPYGGGAGDITVIGSRLYFRAYDGITGYELWVHETNNGLTWQAADIDNGPDSSQPWSMTAVGDRLLFRADGFVPQSNHMLYMMEIEHTITYT